jgi:hypothetical protein
MVKASSGALEVRTETDERDRELRDARRAVEIKCALLADGVRVAPNAVPVERINLTRRHLYDYGVARAGHEIPYEIVLSRLPSLAGLPIIARVRYNPSSEWELSGAGGHEVLRNLKSGAEVPVEVPRVTDFRGHQVMGHELSLVVQRLGYDLLGLVPTNYCSYYTSSEKCAFCEIVETFKDESPAGAPYRKRLDLLIAATELAASLDDQITSLTYNGGQLAGYDQTVRMYVQLLRGVWSRPVTRNLDTTIACMPPTTLSLVDELYAAGLNQLFINMETYDETALERLAPAKARVGIPRMLAAMKHATRSFGVGRVYTNLVYGVQALGAIGADDDATETRLMLGATEHIAAEGVVPTFTVYHSSGRNGTGLIRLSGGALYDFTCGYGEAVWASGVIDHSRESILFTIGSLPNTTYNDGWILALLSSNRR